MIYLADLPPRFNQQYAHDEETDTRVTLYRYGDELRIAMTNDPNATLDAPDGWVKIKLSFDQVAEYCDYMREVEKRTPAQDMKQSARQTTPS